MMEDDGFSIEFKKALARDRRYLKAQLLNATGLTLDELRILIDAKVFPPARCHEVWGPSWNSVKIDAFVWGLRHSALLANRAEFALGYRHDDWAE